MGWEGFRFQRYEDEVVVKIDGWVACFLAGGLGIVGLLSLSRRFYVFLCIPAYFWMKEIIGK